MKKARGTLQSDFTVIIPFLLMVSKSRITNGTDVDKAEEYPKTGGVYAVHITPFFCFGLVVPTFINRALNKE